MGQAIFRLLFSLDGEFVIAMQSFTSRKSYEKIEALEKSWLLKFLGHNYWDPEQNK